MKKLLWKPSRITWQINLLIAIIAIIGVVVIEIFKVNIKQPYYTQKLRAAKIMRTGMAIVRKHRVDNFGPINKKIDTPNSGLIGVLSSPITSSTIELDAKLTTINPNWAAVVVDMLKNAKVKDGSTVAVSFTGSFPAINLAVLSAARAMNLRLIIITSVSSSTWGANLPNFTWLDMESLLVKKGLFNYRTVAASLGGVKDNAYGMSDDGRRMLRAAIARNGIPMLEFEDVKDNINARTELYVEKSGDVPISAYINVGGGTISTGTYIGKRRFKPGLNIKPSHMALKIDSVMSRYAREGIPVMNMNYMSTIAKEYDLPTEIKKMPKIGAGNLYNRLEYNRLLVLGTLAVLLLSIYFFIGLGIGYRIFSLTKKEERRPPEHMV
ncbi:MAG: poly-gamma-glutamate system protein [Spirochaetes bacterium]|jgi:poly-gamma-glutamate system protein|nr:poly-gamma-glutamate system protein [Spirochaetota bacterium]